MKTVKSKLTLDFNSPTSYAKKAKLKTCILESPDLKMLKLASPELERMILQQNGLVTPTPSSALPYLLKLKPELEPEPGHEQEQYAQGFAQEEKHSPINKDSDDSSDKKSATTEAITEPIDMQDQERIKLERKRLRNRIAASKCRRKKLDRIATLEEKVSQLKGENSELSTVVTKLRQQVSSLKEQIMEHVKHGCELDMTR